MIPAIVLALALVSARFLLRRFLPWRAVSADTAVFCGFLAYFVVPLAAMQDRIAIAITEYCSQVVAAYIAFLIGSIAARRLLSNLRVHPLKWISATAQSRLSYGAGCLLFTLYFLWRIWNIGGVTQLVYNWTYGDIHRKTLDQFTAAEGDAALSIVMALASTILFIYSWTGLFTERRWLGWIVWSVYMLSILTEYVGRSIILSTLVLPLIIQIYLKRTPLRKLVPLLLPAGVLILVLGSWLAHFRLGARYEFSTERVLEDTSADAGNSIAWATLILADPSYRSSALDYLSTYVFYPIPRVLWHDKPGNNFNALLTRIMSGHEISRDHSILTFTMLGEGWFYFGAAGGVILLFGFGFMATSVTTVLSRSRLWAGVYCYAVAQTALELRSTLLSYFQFCVVLLLVVFLVNWFERAFFRRTQRSVSRERRQVIWVGRVC